MIQKAVRTDAQIVAKLAVKMWTSHTEKELKEDFESTLSDDNNAVFLCYLEDIPVGFAQCSLRTDYVEGTDSSPVGYLEGVFVDGAYRKQGYAKALVKACEDWAKERGCTEFASDCELGNTESFAFHLHTGFTEANRIICFTKKI